MSRRNAAIVLILLMAVVAVALLAERRKRSVAEELRASETSPVANVQRTTEVQRTNTPSTPASAGAQHSGQTRALPRLVDLGAHACIPCRMMAPILTQLQKEYSSVFKTEFIDVWKDPEAGRRYGIRVIPTQIFFDAEGRELYRHEGFFSKEDILATWERFGVKAAKTNGSAGGVAPP